MSSTSFVTITPLVKTSKTTRHSNCLPPDRLSSLIDNSKTINRLKQIHAFLIRQGLESHPILNFKLQRSYSSLDHLVYSMSLLKLNENPTVFYYTSIIHSHTVQGLHGKAFDLYIQMLTQGIEPNAFTFSAILKGCPLESGKALHGQALKLGHEANTYVRTALVDSYARAAEIVAARKLFDTMQDRTLVSLTAMITGYAKCGLVDEAKLLFDEMEERDVVCWNVMIDGYTQHGRPNEALILFQEMLSANMKPNEVTLVAVLSACGQLGALASGRWIHALMRSNRIQLNAHVASALIDMYSKCGSLDDARIVFNMIKDKDVVVWNSMIVGYAMHGFSQEALQLFDVMHKICNPSDITFIGILNACAHSGLVSEGQAYFQLMKDQFGIVPKIEHYGCMVNLLGRAGHLDKAFELINDTNIESDPFLLLTLLGACRLHGNIELAEKIVQLLTECNVANSGTYILLSNLYASKGDWNGVAKMRDMLKRSGVQKEPGSSSIEIDGRVHEFLAGDQRHPNGKEIYMMLEEINRWLKSHGYTPHTDSVLQDIGEVEKQRSLEVHSEKLAIAFGLISTRPGTTIKIVKNLRVCPDCHLVTKLISKITGRKIIVRDRSRFHHFANGSCSCGDYW